MSITAPLPNPAATAPSYMSQLIQWGDGLLSDPTVQKVIQVAAGPLVIVVASYYLPYFILDPTTNLIGVGCAVLVNSVALQYLHAWLFEKWSNHWDSVYPIDPVAHALPSPTAPPNGAPPQLTPLHPLLEEITTIEAEVKVLKEAYKTALQELEEANSGVKRAKIKLDSADKGRDVELNNLRVKANEKKEELFACATTKKGLIKGLIAYEKVIESHGQKLDELKDNSVDKFGDKDYPERVQDAKKIIGKHLDGIAIELKKSFDVTQQALNKTKGPSYMNAEGSSVSIGVLEDDKNKLLAINSALETNLNRCETIEKKKQDKLETKETLQSELDAIDSVPGIPPHPKVPLTIKHAKEAMEAARAKITEKKQRKLELLEQISKCRLHGLSLENKGLLGLVGENSNIDFESEESLIKLLGAEETEIKQKSTIPEIIVKLEDKLLQLRLVIDEERKQHLSKLGKWVSLLRTKGYEAVDKYNEAKGGVWGRRQNLGPEVRDKHLAYYEALNLALDYLRNACEAVLTSNSPRPPPGPQTVLPLQVAALDPAKSVEENKELVKTYRETFEKEITQTSNDVRDLSAMHKTLIGERFKKEIEKPDFAYTISVQARLLPPDSQTFPINKYIQDIRIHREEVVKIKERKNIAEARIPLIQNALELRRTEIKNLQTILDSFLKDEFIPAELALSRANDAYVAVDVRRSELKSQIQKIDEDLESLKKENDEAVKERDSNTDEQTRLNNRIALAGTALALNPIILIVTQILKIQDKTIVGTYEKLAADLELEEKNKPEKTQEALAAKANAEANKLAKRRAERDAFEALAIKRAELSKKEINSLRRKRLKKIKLHSEKIRDFYRNKTLTLNSPSLEAAATDRRIAKWSEIQRLKLKILEAKVNIAAERMTMDSFLNAHNKLDNSNASLAVDRARLDLVEQRLKRERILEKWKILKGENKLDEEIDPVKEIKKEQKLVLRYFTLKLCRDSKADSKHAVKANVALLHLILDRIYFEISTLSSAQLAQYSVVNKIKTYCEEVQTMEEAPVFNAWAYGDPSHKQAHNPSLWGKIWGENRREVPVPVQNIFMEKLKAALKIDIERMGANAAVRATSHNNDDDNDYDDRIAVPANDNAVLSEQLINFIDEVNNRSKLLDQEQAGNVHEQTTTAKLIRAKVNLIQHSLSKPSPEEGRFIGRFTDLYLPAKADYQAYKYGEIIKYATAEEERNNSKLLYQEAVLLDEQLAAAERSKILRQQAAAAAAAADVRQRIAAQERRDLALRTRQEAVESSQLEKLSYLIPTIALSIIYALATAAGSPLLTYISLSWRVSQNILLMGSATHLFVQSFFHRQHEPVPVLQPANPTPGS